MPYTNSKGDIPMARFGEVRSAHGASCNFLCQSLKLSPTNFLMMFIKFLLLDSAIHPVGNNQKHVPKKFHDHSKIKLT